MIITSGPVLELQMAELTAQSHEPAVIKTLADAERAHIVATLEKTNWVIGGQRGAAIQLGLPRTTLIAMMQRHGLFREAPGQPADTSYRRANNSDRSSAPLPTGR